MPSNHDLEQDAQIAVLETLTKQLRVATANLMKKVNTLTLRVYTLEDQLGLQDAVPKPTPKSRAKTVRVEIAAKRAVNVPFGPDGILTVVERFRVADGVWIDYALGQVLGAATTDGVTRVFYAGGAGQRGRISVNGQSAEFLFPDQPRPVEMDLGGVLVVAMNRELAPLVWFTPDGPIIGPWSVGEKAKGRYMVRASRERTTSGRRSPSEAEYPVVCYGPTVETERYKLAGGIGRFDEWTGPISPSEVAGKGGKWKRIPGPRPAETLGFDKGPMWYRVRVRSKTERKASLLFTAGGDRLMGHVNGSYAFTWGRGPGADEGSVEVKLAKGTNDLVVFADIMGRPNYGGHLDELKGVAGPVYLDPRPAEPAAAWRGIEPLPDTARGHWEVATNLPNFAGTVKVLDLEFEIGKNEILHAAWRGVDQRFYVFRSMGTIHYHAGNWDAGYGSFTLAGPAKADTLKLSLAFLEKTPRDVLEGFSFHIARRDSALAGPWHVHGLALPRRSRKPDPDARIAYWRTGFTLGTQELPLFLETRGLGKGLVWLNGHAVGAYWSIGPQDRLYLPEPWLEKTNTLEILDYEGKSPRRVRVTYAEKH